LGQKVHYQLDEERTEDETIIEMAQYEIREWKSFIKLAKKRLS